MVRLQGKSEIETAVLSAYNSTIEKSLCEYQFSAMLFHVFQKLTGQKTSMGTFDGNSTSKENSATAASGFIQIGNYAADARKILGDS